MVQSNSLARRAADSGRCRALTKETGRCVAVGDWIFAAREVSEATRHEQSVSEWRGRGLVYRPMIQSIGLIFICNRSRCFLLATPQIVYIMTIALYKVMMARFLSYAVLYCA